MKTDKSQRNDNNRIKYLFVVALCLLAIAIGIKQATAAYLSISNMKAVASTNENEALFNSNYLYGYKSAPSSIATNTVEINGAGSEVRFNISIFNYHKQDINLVSQSDITYDLTVEVTGSQSGNYSAYRVNDTSVGSDGNLTIRDVTLKGRKAGINNYMITMPTEDLDYAQIKVMATVKAVSGGTGTNIYCLAAMIAPSKRSQVASPSVDGKLVEKGDLTEYDAYNYEITVGGNASEVELSWNSNIVEIDPFFAKEFGISGNPGTARLTLPIGTRVVQFYRTGADKPSDEGELGISVRKL
ncbi:MAG: hypothetical protein PUC20_00800 [Firmicutes bacterium]|nr:hypothetical protein [Bacillota bacterium]